MTRLVRSLGQRHLLPILGDILVTIGAVLVASRAAVPLALALLALALVTVSIEVVRPVPTSESSAAVLTGSSILTRILLVFALSLWADATARWPAAIILMIAVLAEQWVVLPLMRLGVPSVQNLPGLAVRNRPVLTPGWIPAITSSAVVLFCVMTALRAPGWLLMLLAVVVGLVSVVTAGDAAARILGRHRANRKLPAALRDYQPTFLLYWYAPTGSAQQLAMWLPYLERLNRPFIVVLRNPASFAEIIQITTRPVLVQRHANQLDVLLVPTLKSVFFVNSSPKNADMLAFLGLTQIQLNHGDSDKATSYRRLFRLYDKNFVAGQAAIDRFANHGVEVPRSTFEIVGRPQVEGIAVAGRAIAERPSKTVLYAPTWYGYLTDSRYSSLPVGHTIVTALIELGCTVVFRPHPWSRSSEAFARQVDRIDQLLREDRQVNGRGHVFGRAAQVEASLVDCFNASDALISDVSSVVTDFLYSEKPFAVVAMRPGMSEEELIVELPLAAGGYMLPANMPKANRVLDELLRTDTRAKIRKDLKSYYLGDFSPQNYADGFLDAARRYV